MQHAEEQRCSLPQAEEHRCSMQQGQEHRRQTENYQHVLALRCAVGAAQFL